MLSIHVQQIKVLESCPAEKHNQVVTDTRIVNVLPAICLSVMAAGAYSSPFLLEDITQLLPYLGPVLDAIRQHFGGDAWLSLKKFGASDRLCLEPVVSPRLVSFPYSFFSFGFRTPSNLYMLVCCC